MRDVVADTHALVWHLVEPRKLGKSARRAFAAADVAAASRVAHARLISSDAVFDPHLDRIRD